MELLEAREAALRRRVAGAQPPKGASYAAQSMVTRIQRVNAQLEQLNATITGFARLTELYQANRGVLELNRSATTAGGGDELKRAIILSSESHIAGVVAEFHKLKDLQRYVAQLQQLHSTSAQAQDSIGKLEATHAQQKERALLVHARVEKILGVYQEMIQVLSEKCVEYSAVVDRLVLASSA